VSTLRPVKKAVLGAAALLLWPGGLLLAQQTSEESAPFPFLPNPVQTVSVVPANGDQNPYGVAFVPPGFPAGGPLHVGDILVSNFNNQMNQQGTGTTIVQVPANGGAVSVFFQGQSGLGLSTALEVLKEGTVIVGNLPTTDGTCATAQAGSLLVIDSNGTLQSTLTDANINGPWDMAVNDLGRGRVQAFVANAIAGTVARLDLQLTASGATIENSTVIATGYMHRCDPAALFVAPTGLVFDRVHDLLYVASTEDNAVFVVRNAATATHSAGKGHLVYQDAVHLHGALAMAQAPNGDLLVSNSDVINSDPNQPSEIVEFTISGRFVKQLSMDPAQGGSFGLNVAVSGHNARFAAVDDNAGTLSIWTLPAPPGP
jgi:hypothetical protein